MEDFSVEIQFDSDLKNAFSIETGMKSGRQNVKKSDQTIYSFKFSGDPCHKFFRKGADILVFIGSSFCSSKYLINLSQNIVHETTGIEFLKGPIWVDIYPNPTGDFFMAIDSSGTIDFYDFRETQASTNAWRSMEYSVEDEYDDDYDLEVCSGKVEFKWLDDTTFYFHKYDDFDITLKMNNDLTYTVKT